MEFFEIFLIGWAGLGFGKKSIELFHKLRSEFQNFENSFVFFTETLFEILLHRPSECSALGFLGVSRVE